MGLKKITANARGPGGPSLSGPGGPSLSGPQIALFSRLLPFGHVLNI